MAKVIVEEHMSRKISAENYNDGAKFVIELSTNSEMTCKENFCYDFELHQ